MADWYFKTEKFTVGYNNVPIVSDVEIGINKGEIVSLIGPNGSGKTTFIRSVINQLRPIAGAAFLENVKLSEITAKDLSKKLAVVLTDRITTELTTVYDIVGTGRYPYTGLFGLLGKEDREIVDKVMKLINIEELADKDFMKISDGQKQRVMLARALAQEPDIIVLDEPTSFLDIKYKMEFLSTLKKLARETGLTVIMSLHEIDMAQMISDKVACVKGGRLDSFGTPEEIFKDDYIIKLYDIDVDSLTPEFKKMLGK